MFKNAKINRWSQRAFMLLSFIGGIIFGNTLYDYYKESKNTQELIASKPSVEITQYENGKVKSIVTRVHGIKHGKNIFYDQNGNIVWDMTYKNGVLHDTANHFYENGKIYDMTIYKDGTFIQRNIYNEDGSLAYKSSIEDGYCVERDRTDTVIYSKDSTVDRYCK